MLDRDQVSSGLKYQVTAVVLTYNEEDNIKRCIGSLKWCRRVIVIDSGSHDKTREYARELGAIVYTHKQRGRFLITEQRNWAIKECGFDTEWILFMDADEVVGDECREDIVKTLRDCGEFNSFELAPRYWFFDKWLRYTQGYPCWHPRLIKRGAVFFTGGVWESLDASAKTSRIKTPYEHYAFSKGLDDWLERHRRYADWEAKKIVKYLDSRDDLDLGTNRQIRLRKLSSRLWVLRPVMRFAQKYLLQKGFLDGWQGFAFCSLMLVYDIITVIKVVEKKYSREASQ